MWLSPEILDWETIRESSQVEDTADVRRPYQMLNHAEQILFNATSDLNLVDVITNLKRAVDHRVRSLVNKYEFKKIPGIEKKKPTLELMGILGIVRPAMLIKLIDVRNAVEHKDFQPPSKEICQEFCELVWYFLRSTDNLTAFVTRNFTYESPNNYTISVSTGPFYSWKVDIYGWLPKELISFELKNDWLSLTEFEINLFSEPLCGKRLSTDVSFQGKIYGSPFLLNRVYQSYFSLLG